MKGKIKKIVEKEGKNGKYYAVCIDDQWYTAFTDMSDFQEGDTVKFGVRETAVSVMSMVLRDCSP